VAPRPEAKADREEEGLMDLIEIETKRTARREQVAEWLHQLADSLARHNDIEFVREGIRYTVDVPDTLEVKVELEIEDDESSLEIELKW
jgi:amphi-Trp domain-containing protein